MKKITDEMLNDYLDNQLDSSSLNEFKGVINSDEESLNKLKAIKIIDDSLRNLEVYEAPVFFTEKMMDIIVKNSKAMRPKINYFFTGVVSLFGIIITTVLVTAFILTEKQVSHSSSVNIIEPVKNFVSENISSFNKLFANNQVIFAGGLLAAILLLSALVIFDTHKNFKNKLKSITH